MTNKAEALTALKFLKDYGRKIKPSLTAPDRKELDVHLARMKTLFEGVPEASTNKKEEVLPISARILNTEALTSVLFLDVHSAYDGKYPLLTSLPFSDMQAMNEELALVFGVQVKPLSIFIGRFIMRDLQINIVRYLLGTEAQRKDFIKVMYRFNSGSMLVLMEQNLPIHRAASKAKELAQQLRTSVDVAGSQALDTPLMQIFRKKFHEDCASHSTSEAIALMLRKVAEGDKRLAISLEKELASVLKTSRKGR